jgi:hypothetical protein
MGKARYVLLLSLVGFTRIARGQKTQTEGEREYQFHLGQLQEMAMCHHAIKAAYHDGIALSQNPLTTGTSQLTARSWLKRLSDPGAMQES